MLMFDDSDDPNPTLVPIHSPWWWVAWYQRRVSIIFWSIDFPLSFFKGYIDRQGQRETRLHKVALKYVITGLPLDMFLLVIEYVTFFLAGFSQGKILRVLRYSRSLKAGKLRRLSSRLLARVKEPETLAMISMFGYLCGVIFMCHMFGCLWYGIGIYIEVDGRQWTQVFSDPDGPYAEDLFVNVDNHAFRYFTSFRWALAQLGFGDSQVYPVNWLESLFSVLFSCVCVIVMTHLIGLIITSMIRLQEGNREQRESESSMRDYFRQHNVSFDLQDRIWQVLKELRQKGSHRTTEDKVALIAELPQSLEIELRAQVFVPALTSHPFFGVYGVSGADPHAMHNIIRKRAVELRLLEPKQEVFSEHELATAMWFVVQGSISYRWKHKPYVVRADGVFEDDGKHQKITSPGQVWVAEAALWLHWRYVGSCVSRALADVAELQAEAFREIVQADLPQAQKYAKAFAASACKNPRKFHELCPLKDVTRLMAQDVFAPVSAFKLNECKPIVKRRLDEWKPAQEDWQANWATPWSDAHALSSSAIIATMMTEMKRDIIMVFQTLFSQNMSEKTLFSWPNDQEKDQYEKRVLFLKRLIVMLGMCKVSCTDEDNSTELQQWPYPLASTICHGGRSMMKLVDVSPREVINFLVLGDKDGNNWERNGPPGPMYLRLAASHSVKTDATGCIQELKLKGVAGATGRGHNLGLDIPLGGIGNPTPKHPSGHMFVGPAGVPYRTLGSSNTVKDFQHGHLYVRWDEFGQKATKQLVLEKLPESTEEERPNSKDSHGTEVPGTYQVRGTISRVEGISMSEAATAIAEEPDFTLRTDFVTKLAKKSAARTLTAQDSEQQSGDGEPQEDAIPKTLNELVDSVDALESRLPVDIQSRAGEDKVRCELLLKYANDRHELLLEQDHSGKLARCRGVMVHLAIELEANPQAPEELVLVHLGAAAQDSRMVVSKTPSGSNIAMEDPKMAQGVKSVTGSQSFGGGTKSKNLTRGATGATTGRSQSTLDNIIQDQRGITVLCQYDSLWLPALLGYVQRSFQLGDNVMDKIYQGLSEEVYLGTCGNAPTINHHHAFACGPVEVQYDALYLTCRLKREDAPVLEKFITPAGARLSDDFVFVSGLGDVQENDNASFSLCPVKREWAWIEKSRAEELGFKDLKHPSDALKLKLQSTDASIGSLLFGIENSAPLKEDLFGGTHNASAKSKDVSAFGRRKWRDFRRHGQRLVGQWPAPPFCKVPAELGGTQMTLGKTKFKEIQQVCQELKFCNPSKPCLESDPVQEKEFFQALLCADSKQSRSIIEAYLAGTPLPGRGTSSVLIEKSLMDSERDKEGSHQPRRMQRQLTANLFHLPSAGGHPVAAKDSSEDEEAGCRENTRNKSRFSSN